MEDKQLFIDLENELLKKTKEEREALFQKLEDRREIADKLNGTTHERNTPPTTEEAKWMLREMGVYPKKNGSVRIDLMRNRNNARV